MRGIPMNPNDPSQRFHVEPVYVHSRATKAVQRVYLPMCPACIRAPLILVTKAPGCKCLTENEYVKKINDLFAGGMRNYRLASKEEYDAYRKSVDN